MNFSHIHRKFARRMLAALNTPRALTVLLLIENEEWDQLVYLKVDPAHYSDPETFFRDYQATEMLRKAEGLPTTFDLDQVARDGFHASEMMCAKSNLRLSRYLHNGPFESPEELRIANFLDGVKKRVSAVLGSLPSTLDGRFGPGATFSCKSQASTVCDKMQNRPTMTQNAAPFMYYWKETSWFRGLANERPDCTEPLVVRGNRFATAPKDATRARGIAIEPDINGFFQLGLHATMRKRLLRVGLDLEHGQALHRRMARQASSKGDFCTIDLSSASDTICKVLVELLLSTQWYLALASLRSGFTLIDGKWHLLEKFSSMGNGYTFELETLVFACITAEAVAQQGGEPVFGENVLVYGDDIIVETKFARGVLAVLKYCGFEPNLRKTATSGYFRESCGGDYFNGECVVPFRIKVLPSEPAHWITLSNMLRRTSLDRYGVSVWEGIRSMLHDQIPSSIRRCKGPELLGDLVIHTDDEGSWAVRKAPGCWQQRELLTFTPVTRAVPLLRWSNAVQMSAALYGVPSEGVVRRSSVSGYRVGWTAWP